VIATYVTQILPGIHFRDAVAFAQAGFSAAFIALSCSSSVEEKGGHKVSEPPFVWVIEAQIRDLREKGMEKIDAWNDCTGPRLEP
jgi:hypothetical protein